MSEPCPPAFIRTAPPIEPGTPTAHSNPVSPAAAVRRASTGSATPPPAVTTHASPARRRRRARCRRRGRRCSRRSRRSRRRRRAGWTRGRRRAPAAPTPGAAAATRQQVVDRAGRGRTAPPRRRPGTSSSAPSGSSRVASGPRTAAAATSTAVRQRRCSRQPPARRRRARISSGSVAMSPQPIEMHTSPGPTSPARNDTMSVAPRQPHDPGARVGVEHGVDDQPAGDARDRRRAGRVDLGEHDDVGADEGVGVLPPHLGDAVEAVRLEGDDRPAASRRRCRGRRR